jgi:CubicO group peptidase (beta-lactamase class C family)
LILVRIALSVLLAVLWFGQAPAAQTVNVTYSLFERYLEALREQTGIPGLTGAIIRSGATRPEWSQGFGVARTDRSVPVTPDTPMPVGGLSQSIGAALVLRHCVDSGYVTLDDRVQRWSPQFPDLTATFGDVLSHRQGSAYVYHPERFASGLTRAIEECADRPYANVVFDQVIARFVMEYSVPGGDVATSGSLVRQIFPSPDLRRFNDVLLTLAPGYRVDANRRATAAEYRPGATTLSAGDGLIASATDLAIFEGALDRELLVSQDLLNVAWRRRPGGPTGYGWFVQQVNGKRVVWQYGEIRNAYSSMMVKLPDSGLTLILLANSDGLAARFPLANGDITVSPFATIFFSLLG